MEESTVESQCRFVITVRCPVALEEALVLPCEHIMANLAGVWGAQEPPSVQLELLDLRDRWAVASNPFVQSSNLRLGSADHMLRELELLVAADVRQPKPDGLVVVELTPAAMGRNAAALASISTRTGVHIVMATGAPGHSSNGGGGQGTAAMEQQWAAHMERELLFGADASGAPGAQQQPRDVVELRAAAAAQAATGAPVFVSLPFAAVSVGTAPRGAAQSRAPGAGAECAVASAAECVLDAFCGAGGRAQDVVLCAGVGCMSRGDARAAATPGTAAAGQWARLLERGASVCLCVGGGGLLSGGTASAPLADDEDILDLVVSLLGGGDGGPGGVPAARALMISAGVCMRAQLRLGGGSGYGVVCTRFAARLCAAGVPPGIVLALLGGNARRLLHWWSPPPAAEVPKHFIRCSVCDRPFEPIEGEYFSKFEFVYCSTKCLRKHRKQGFKRPLPAEVKPRNTKG
eukprot:g1997.t1